MTKDLPTLVLMASKILSWHRFMASLIEQRLLPMQPEDTGDHLGRPNEDPVAPGVCSWNLSPRRRTCSPREGAGPVSLPPGPLELGTVMLWRWQWQLSELRHSHSLSC